MALRKNADVSLLLFTEIEKELSMQDLSQPPFSSLFCTHPISFNKAESINLLIKSLRSSIQIVAVGYFVKLLQHLCVHCAHPLPIPRVGSLLCDCHMIMCHV